jgi:hypothetical protein
MLSPASKTTALGIFDNPADATKAIHALKNAGYRDADIGIASKAWSKQFDNVGVHEQHLAEIGAVAGSALGATLGAAFGLVGALVVPGAIPVLAGSAMVSALLGGAAGAAGGAYAGPFIAMGFSDTEAQTHGTYVEAGKTVVLVHAPEKLEAARKILVREGAYDEAMANSP